MKVREIMLKYVTHMKALGRSPHTVKNAGNMLKRFATFLENEGVTQAEELNREVIEEYRQELAFSFTAKGSPLSGRSQGKMLSTVKGFTRYLRDNDYLVHDPGAKVMLPKEPKRLPRSIMTQDEVKKVLAAPDVRTNSGYRDRIMLELLYDTAIRKAELSGIRMTDVDLEAGYIRVQGKGDKERVVPVSGRVCGLIRNYLLAVRPELIEGEDPGWLLISDKGNRMHLHRIWVIVKKYATLAKLKKNITTHTFRHTCATHMLKNGAPIRHLQEMLGHESLESTQVYTHVTINDLKEVHAKYHPSEKMEGG